MQRNQMCKAFKKLSLRIFPFWQTTQLQKYPSGPATPDPNSRVLEEDRSLVATTLMAGIVHMEMPILTTLEIEMKKEEASSWGFYSLALPFPLSGSMSESRLKWTNFWGKQVEPVSLLQILIQSVMKITISWCM